MKKMYRNEGVFFLFLTAGGYFGILHDFYRYALRIFAIGTKGNGVIFSCNSVYFSQ